MPLFHTLPVTALFQTGKLDLAIEKFERALQLRPDHPDTLTGLGLAQEKKRLLETE